MRIVFVIPPFDYARSVGNACRRVKNGILPPLGVGFLAAAVEADGHEARLVDAMAEQFDLDQTVRAVLDHAPDAVGVSIVTSLNVSACVPLVRELRERLPETCPIILGGAHITTAGARALDEFPGAAAVVEGDGETPLRAVLERMGRAADLSGIPGAHYRDADGTVRPGPPPEWPKDLDQFAPPARHIYKAELYRPLPSLNLGRKVTTVITARGCPWARCAFCHQGSGCSVPFRRRSPEHVADELEGLVRDYGIKSIVFWDDSFCVMPGWINRFCDLLDGRRLNLAWSVLARADTVTPDMLRRMAASGCYSIQFGFESGVPEILELVRKGTTLEQYRSAVAWSRAAGLEIRGSFMLGFPTETPAMSEQTIEFACSLNADYMLFFAYHVLPGTALEPVALREGRVVNPPGEGFNIHQPSYVPNTYDSPEQLAAMVRRAYRRYYLRPAYAARLLGRTLRRPSLARNHAVALAYWTGTAFRRNGGG